MKRCFAILLALMIVLSLAACGGKDDDKPAAASPPASSSKPASSAAPNLPPALLEQLEQDKEQPDESKPADSQPSGEEKEPLVKNVGDTVEHGSFEGLTLEWLTLAVDEENEKALLVTKDIIAHWVYDSAVMEDVTWETSDIREWLNGTFYNGAFSEEQKAYILESEIVNSANPVTGTESGADTVDRVFLLSYEEAQTYFPTDESRQACYNFSQEYMAYLAKMMAETPSLEMTEQEALDELDGYNNGTDWPDSWWLRTSGDGQQTAAGVDSDGVLSEYLNQVWSLQGIRPAIWVNLSDEQAAPVEDEPEQTPDNGGEGNKSTGLWDVADADITVLNEGHDVAIVPAGLKKGIGTQSKAQIYLRDPGSIFASIYKSLYEADYLEVAQADVDALVDYIEQEIGAQASEGGLSSYTEYIISTDTMEITILYYPDKNEVKVSAYLN